jgi:hypothetical protein
MAKVAQSPVGQCVTVRAGLRTRHDPHDPCEARAETDGGEVAVIRQGERFNGRFYKTTGSAELLIRCPACGRGTAIGTSVWVATASMADFGRYLA